MCGMTKQQTAEHAPSPNKTETETELLTCDYLIVGAGTACLSFVDTLMTRLPDVTFIIVDRNSGPGGHWTTAYPFVRLHQQSANYGVNSMPLGKLDSNGKEMYDLSDRATGTEICEYYEKVIEQFKATGRVRTYFEANYVGEAEAVANVNSNSNNDTSSSTKSSYTNSNSNSNINSNPAAAAAAATSKITHTITTQNGQRINIECTKIVQCESKVVVPSMRNGVPFPIDESVKTIPLNDLPNHINSIGPKAKASHEHEHAQHDNNTKEHAQQQTQKYLVIGAGKTGVDAIVYLLEDCKVDPDQITWIVSQSAWFLMRDGYLRYTKPGTKFWKEMTRAFFKPLVKANTADEAFLNMERAGAFGRVDPDDANDFPRQFKGATINFSVLTHLRSLKNVVKNKGRVTSITSTQVIIGGGSSDREQYSIPFSPHDTLVVDCMVDNVYGYMDFESDFKFFNPHKIRLGPLLSLFNPSHSSAQVAFLEAEFKDDANGDDVKNSFLYFARGKRELKEMTHQQQFLVQWFAEMKTSLQFEKYPPHARFKLSARTEVSQPDHHGGLFALIWALFGPTKMKKNIDAFIYKMGHGGYEDFPTFPLPGRTEADPKKFANALRTKQPKASKSKSGTRSNSNSNSNSTPSPSPKNASRSVLCCRSADAVVFETIMYKDTS